MTYPQEKPATHTVGRSCDIHHPMKYYQVRTLFKASCISLSRAYSWISQLCSAFLQEPCILAEYQHVECCKKPAGRAQKILFLCSGSEFNTVQCFKALPLPQKAKETTLTWKAKLRTPEWSRLVSVSSMFLVWSSGWMLEATCSTGQNQLD